MLKFMVLCLTKVNQKFMVDGAEIGTPLSDELRKQGSESNPIGVYERAILKFSTDPEKMRQFVAERVRIAMSENPNWGREEAVKDVFSRIRMMLSYFITIADNWDRELGLGVLRQGLDGKTRQGK